MKKVLIIGATSGIGLELAHQFIRKGYAVGGCGRRAEVLNDLEKQYPGQFYGQALDIRHTASLEENLQQLIDRLGGMDICVVGSGISRDNILLDTDVDMDILQTNIMGYSAALLFAARYFLRQRHGHLVGITSLTKYFPNRSVPAYNASKAFAGNYLDSLRLRLHGKNFSVTEIIPGFIDTPMLKNPRRTFWLVPADKAARQIITAIGKKRKRMVVSKRWYLIRWLLPWIPQWLYGKVT